MVGAWSRTRRGVSDPVDTPHQRGTSLAGRLLLALLLVFPTVQYPCHARGGGHGDVPPGGKTAGGKCMEREREALLAVRDDVWGVITDPDQRRQLPAWERDGDCCRWKGVTCDHRSGHVVKLDLRLEPAYQSTVISKVSPSLFSLGSLRYLDLSGNSFGGAPLPSFIGSLVYLEYLNISNAGFSGFVPPELGNLRNLKSLDLSGNLFGGAPLPSFMGSLVYLEYLNISYAGFSGSIPPELGNLWNLRYLDLSGNLFGRAPLPSFNGTKDFFSTIVKNNLHWLSHLSHLQYLDMSWNNLSAAHDWLRVISMLPSLSVLHLRFCDLPVPPSTELPLGNFTSLATLDLVYSSPAGYSTWPLWLSNISGLSTLVLAPLNCTIPSDAFKNMKHLEVLSIVGLSGLIPRSLWGLDMLKTLHLSGFNLRIGSYEDLGHLSSLQELTLSGVVGRLPDSLGNIMGLQSLIIKMDESTTSIELPKSIGKNLVGLKTLWLYGVNTTGEVLRNIGDHLCNLTELTIGGIKANGAEVTFDLLKFLSECKEGSVLEHLDIRGFGYGGHLPDQLGKLKNLRHVALSGNSIVGSIPSSIGGLEILTLLDLSNNSIVGSIPTSIGRL